MNHKELGTTFFHPNLANSSGKEIITKRAGPGEMADPVKFLATET